MKKGGVAWEIKGCRRRCLHHPTPMSAGKRREGSEKEAIRPGTQQSNTPYTCTCIHTLHHTTPYNVVHRALAVWYARHTLSSPRRELPRPAR